MNVGLVTSNAAFSKPIETELNRRGHEVFVYSHTEDHATNLFQLGQLRGRVDRVLVDWAQPPLELVLQHLQPENVPVFVRAHRIEMYADDYIKSIPWEKVAGVFFVAKHVQDRFCEKIGTSPKRVISLPHVGIDPDFWQIDEAAQDFEPPYIIAMAGNLVPKKRLYTAVQMLADLPEEWRLHFFGSGGMPGYGNPEYHVNVSDLIADIGIGDRFYSPEGGRLPQAELLPEYQKAHVILSASNEEGCHTSVAEGMACGCVPMVGNWRGARDIYPPEWVWRSPKEFYALADKWVGLTTDAKAELARQMRDFVLPKYDATTIAAQVVDMVCAPIDSASIASYYNTTMLAQMIEQDGNERQVDALKCVADLLAQLTGGDKSVLEVGCGTGYVSREIAKLPGVTATGMDIAEELLKWAQAHNEYGARFERVDVTQGLAGGKHDIITAIDCLEHVQSQYHKAVVIRIAAQLKPGGFFVARFPHTQHDTQIVEEKIFPKVLRKWCVEAGLMPVVHREVAPYFEIVARKGAV